MDTHWPGGGFEYGKVYVGHKDPDEAMKAAVKNCTAPVLMYYRDNSVIQHCGQLPALRTRDMLYKYMGEVRK